MQLSDGGLKEIKGPHIKLVAFGSVDNQLMEHLHESLADFFHSLEKLEINPMIVTQRMDDPQNMVKGQESNAFFDVLFGIPANMVMGVTHHGLYDQFLGRDIFGYGCAGVGILSTKRFYNAGLGEQKTRELIGKEVLKIIGLSCGVLHCNNPNCVMARHRYVLELENNTGVCPNCGEKMVKELKRHLNK